MSPLRLGRCSSLLVRTTTAVLCSSTLVAAAMSTKVIDSHLHVWANTDEVSSGVFPYAQEPPDDLRDKASTTALLKQMEQAGVDGALIVQPINHKFDHSYVLSAVKEFPKFKGMLLHDPSLSAADAVSRLEELALAGFVGVRFNPYLWEKLSENKWKPMSTSTDSGLAVYKRCGELGMPVGVMCFQGLALHYDDILELLKQSPETTLILDHFGFTSINDPDAFDKLLKLAEYPQVYVKISALFRLDVPSPYERVRTDRFLPLLAAFGCDRLMYGSDFPFVLQQPEAYKIHELVSSWCPSDSDRTAIMGGTAERIFGPWGVRS